MTANYEIQTVSQAFSARVPEKLWRTVGKAKTTRGAYRVYAREHRWYHPQQNAWTGHVRVLRDGSPVQIERLETIKGVQYEVNQL